MNYKPYSPEWNRKRFLREALESYLNDYVDTEIIYQDIQDILHERSESLYHSFSHTVDLEYKIHSK